MYALLRAKLPLLCSLILLFAGSGFLPRAADASLIGTDVVVSVLEVQGADTTTHFSDTVAVVDPGPEIIGLFDAFDVDISAETIRIDITDSGNLGSADFLGFLFESLTWGNTAGEIIGFSAADTNIVGIDNSRLQFGPHEVAFNLQGLDVNEGNFLEVSLEVQHQVPEPSTLGMLLAGGGLMSWVRARRRRSR